MASSIGRGRVTWTPAGTQGGTIFATSYLASNACVANMTDGRIDGNVNIAFDEIGVAGQALTINLPAPSAETWVCGSGMYFVFGDIGRIVSVMIQPSTSPGPLDSFRFFLDDDGAPFSEQVTVGDQLNFHFSYPVDTAAVAPPA